MIITHNNLNQTHLQSQSALIQDKQSLGTTRHKKASKSSSNLRQSIYLNKKSLELDMDNHRLLNQISGEPANLHNQSDYPRLNYKNQVSNLSQYKNAHKKHKSQVRTREDRETRHMRETLDMNFTNMEKIKAKLKRSKVIPDKNNSGSKYRLDSDRKMSLKWNFRNGGGQGQGIRVETRVSNPHKERKSRRSKTPLQKFLEEEQLNMNRFDPEESLNLGNFRPSRSAKKKSVTRRKLEEIDAYLENYKESRVMRKTGARQWEEEDSKASIKCRD